MSELTKITFHGNLAEALDQKEFELKVNNVAEALRAVDVISKRKLSKAIVENENGATLFSTHIDYVVHLEIRPLFEVGPFC